MMDLWDWVTVRKNNLIVYLVDHINYNNEKGSERERDSHWILRKYSLNWNAVASIIESITVYVWPLHNKVTLQHLLSQLK